MAAVDWEHISEKEYEDIVSMLLNLLYPTSRRIDGGGGDGGRDVQYEGAGGLHAFQLKSFTGRLSQGRRQQIKESLKVAVSLRPVDWTLIVPIDPTPGELEWFDRLRPTVTFPIEYHGRTWLDAQLAARPYIARYVIEDAANEVARLAELFDQETAVLTGGAPEALARAGALGEQLNNLDPYYRYEVTVGESARSVRIIPRYDGALTDHPITGTLSFRFPDDAAGRATAEAVRHAIEYGTGAIVPPEYVERATLDAPGQLGGSWERAAVEIGPAEHAPIARTFILVCESPDGSRLIELPLDFQLKNQGRTGAIWEAEDRTGTLSVVLTSNRESHAFNLRLRVSPVENYYPLDMLATVRFLHEFIRPNLTALHAENGTRLGQLTEGPEQPWVEAFMPDLVADLVAIQAAAHMTRRVRAGATREELQAVGVAGALLRGETVDMTWEQLTFEVKDAPWPGGPESLFRDEWPVRLVTREQNTVTFADVEYPLGRRAVVEYTARLGGIARRVGDEIEIDPIPAEWIEAGAIPSGTLVAVVPGSTNHGRLSLINDSAV